MRFYIVKIVYALASKHHLLVSTCKCSLAVLPHSIIDTNKKTLKLSNHVHLVGHSQMSQM